MHDRTLLFENIGATQELSRSVREQKSRLTAMSESVAQSLHGKISNNFILYAEESEKNESEKSEQLESEYLSEKKGHVAGKEMSGKVEDKRRQREEKEEKEKERGKRRKHEKKRAERFLIEPSFTNEVISRYRMQMV